jgi:hypothetical protein
LFIMQELMHQFPVPLYDIRKKKKRHPKQVFPSQMPARSLSCHISRAPVVSGKYG